MLCAGDLSRKCRDQKVIKPLLGAIFDIRGGGGGGVDNIIKKMIT